MYNLLTTPRAGQFQVTLPDGTNVWLNNASSLRYPTVFAGKHREVELKGEAYFEVSNDPSKPFHVIANGLDVEVLGTTFNIMAYEDEPVRQVTLLTGAVKLTHSNKSVRLKPGEQAQVDQVSTMNVIPDADVDGAIAWKNGYFHFNKADIQTVMRQLARWYDVDVSYTGDVTSHHFNGDIPRNLMLSHLLKILERKGMHFRQTGTKLIVEP
jgi:ferric-dicitrate binding protein FerR (iron transport regulator)